MSVHQSSLATLVPGQPILKNLRISSVVADEEFQYRTGDLQVESLAESIAKDGQRSPIFVRPHADGRWQLISGYRRLAALKKLGRSSVLALIMTDLTDQKAVHVSLLENLEREALSEMDRINTAARLLSEGMSKKAIAGAFNQSVRSIERLLVLSKAPSEYQGALQRGEISIIQAYEAFRRGVPAEEVISSRRSVSFLRQVARKRGRARVPAISITLRYVAGKTDPAKIIAQAEQYISLVKKAISGESQSAAPILNKERQKRHTRSSTFEGVIPVRKG